MEGGEGDREGWEREIERDRGGWEEGGERNCLYTCVHVPSDLLVTRPYQQWLIVLCLIVLYHILCPSDISVTE